jgi:hypothetical protein
VKGRDIGWLAEQAVIAVKDGTYRFDRMKSKPPAAEARDPQGHVRGSHQGRHGARWSAAWRAARRSGKACAREGPGQPARQRLHADLSRRAGAGARQAPRHEDGDPRSARTWSASAWAASSRWRREAASRPSSSSWSTAAGRRTPRP